MNHHMTWFPYVEYERITRDLANPRTFDEWLIDELDRILIEEHKTLVTVDNNRYIFRERGLG